MNAILAMLLWQHIVSVKAGLIHHIEGEVSARLHETVPVNTPVVTGAASRVEILLNPGSFLRMGSESEAVIRDARLDHVHIEVVRGEAMIESMNASRKKPLTVTTGGLTVSIVEPGLYRVEGAGASVLKGKLAFGDKPEVLKKGWKVAVTDQGLQRWQLPRKPAETALDTWSRDRARKIFAASEAWRQTSVPQHMRGVWLPANQFGILVTYIPFADFDSPWGFRSAIRDPWYMDPFDRRDGPRDGGSGRGSEPKTPPAFPADPERDSPEKEDRAVRPGRPDGPGEPGGPGGPGGPGTPREPGRPDDPLAVPQPE